jgi:hypothetical protein
MGKKALMAAIMVVAIVWFPFRASATSAVNFQVKTTRDLVALCETPQNDPLRVAAVHFCEGFAVGAYQYHLIAEAATKAKPLFCLPNPTPSRDEAIQQFIAWSKRQTVALDAPAVEGIFTFLRDQYPCG